MTLPMIIEVVDLVWKGLRQGLPVPGRGSCRLIEVVDLVWKGLRHCITVNTNVSFQTN